MGKRYDYAVGVGHNAPILTNMQDLVTDAPVAERVPMGPVARRTLDKRTRFAGTRIINWSYTAISRVEFNIFINFVSNGDLTAHDWPLTIYTPDHTDTFRTYNVYLTNPQPSQHWRREVGGALVDLQIPITIDSLIDEFTSEFTYEFRRG